MEWLIVIAAAGLAYYRLILVKRGNLKFWRMAKSHPRETYSFFLQNDASVVLGANQLMDTKQTCQLANGMAPSGLMFLQ